MTHRSTGERRRQDDDPEPHPPFREAFDESFETAEKRSGCAHGLLSLLETGRPPPGY
jgi:hypothetical protein